MMRRSHSAGSGSSRKGEAVAHNLRIDEVEETVASQVRKNECPSEKRRNELNARALACLRSFSTTSSWSHELSQYRSVSERRIQQWKSGQEIIPMDRLAQIVWVARKFRDELEPLLDWMSEWERRELDNRFGPARDPGMF